MPSCRAPTIAIAPIQMVREAARNPSTNWLSSLPPNLFFSHSPKPSILFSRSIHSPIREPTTREKIISMVPSVLIVPSPITNISFNAPEMPIKIVQSPRACISISWYRSFSPFFRNSPRLPPKRTASTFTIVPIPLMISLLFL